MKRRILPISLAGVLAISLAACQRTNANPSASATPGPAPEATITTSTAVAESGGAIRTTTTTTTTTLTVDPVEASQYNARRRSTASAAAGSSQPVGASEARRERAPHRERIVPAGTILRVKLDRTVSTATSREGEEVSGELLDDLLAEDETVAAPSGSRVRGVVEHVVDSGKLARPAELKFRLTDLEVGGRSVPISTSAYSRVGDTHTKRNAGYIAGGAAVGAILGQVLGRDTKATLEGAAAGAAAGTGVAAATGDLDFQIEAGRPVAFTLEQPLRL